MLCSRLVLYGPCPFVWGPTSTVYVIALTVLTLFRNRVHSSASLLVLVPVSGGLMTVVSPPAVLNCDVAVDVSAELSENGPLLMTMMKFLSQVPVAIGDWYCGPAIDPLTNARGSAFTLLLPAYALMPA